MREYDFVAVFWEDHYSTITSPIPKNPDDIVTTPTLTVGILLCETEKTLLIAHDIERYEDHDNASYTVLIKQAIVGRKKYGSIELDNIRFADQGGE